MNFIKQTKQEMKLIISTKFLLIAAAVLMAYSFVMPFIESSELITGFSDDDYSEELIPVTINGVKVTSDNPLYYEFRSLKETIRALETDSDPLPLRKEAKKIALDLADEKFAVFARISAEIRDDDDFRLETAEIYLKTISIKKFLEAYSNDLNDLNDLIEAMNIVMPEIFDLSYIFFEIDNGNISESQKRERLEELNQRIEIINYILDNKDADDTFDRLIDLMISQKQDQQKFIQSSIDWLESMIIYDPGSEEESSGQVAVYKNEIEALNAEIDLLNLRREGKINPSDISDWRNSAIRDIRESSASLNFKMLSKEEFALNREVSEEFGIYQNYEKGFQEQMNIYNRNILIAQNSLDTGKPDMRYADGGARSAAYISLIRSSSGFLFAVLLGGWLIANEHQSGTVRLLLIRPKTRTRILMSKYLSALICCFLVYLGSQILSMLAAGIISGFGDFLNPNYTVSGPVSFFSVYLSRFAVCFLPVLFMLTFSFMLSVLLKNTALSVIIPFGLYLGTSAVRNLESARLQNTDYLAYVPFRYLSFLEVFIDDVRQLSGQAEYSVVYGAATASVQMNVTLGAVQLLVYSAVSLAAAVIVFSRQDVRS